MSVGMMTTPSALRPIRPVDHLDRLIEAAADGLPDLRQAEPESEAAMAYREIAGLRWRSPAEASPDLFDTR
jgi:hypothetical protein